MKVGTDGSEPEQSTYSWTCSLKRARSYEHPIKRVGLQTDAGALKGSLTRVVIGRSSWTLLQSDPSERRQGGACGGGLPEKRGGRWSMLMAEATCGSKMFLNTFKQVEILQARISIHTYCDIAECLSSFIMQFRGFFTFQYPETTWHTPKHIGTKNIISKNYTLSSDIKLIK